MKKNEKFFTNFSAKNVNKAEYYRRQMSF